METLNQLSHFILDFGTSVLISAVLYGIIGFIAGLLIMRKLLKIGIGQGILDRPMKIWSAFTNIYRIYLPLAAAILVGSLGTVMGINQGVNGFVEDQVDVAIDYITPNYLNASVFDKYKKTAPASAAIAREVGLHHAGNDYMTDLVSTYVLDGLGNPSTVADLQNSLNNTPIDFAKMAAAYTISDYFTSFIDMRFVPVYIFLFFSLGVFLFQLPFIEMLIGIILHKVFAPRPVSVAV